MAAAERRCCRDAVSETGVKCAVGYCGYQAATAANRAISRSIDAATVSSVNSQLYSQFIQSQEIRWEEHLRNDLFCVEWDAKPCSIPYHRNMIARYDTICYFNVRSKADISQRNLPHKLNLAY